MYTIKFDHRTAIGHVREVNEDAFAIVPGNDASGALAVVCDGMGGVEGGEIASRIACETFFDYPVYRDGVKPFHAGANRRRLERLIQLANLKIRDFVHHHPRYRGMGTTVSALLFLEDKIVLAHVGDSRIYRLRNGQLALLTQDQTLRCFLLHTGRLAPEEAYGHPSGHVLMQAVGASRQLSSIQSMVDELADGDRYLLCSDGLSDLLRDDEIQAILQSRPFGQVCGDLMHLALARGGHDNVTLIAVDVAAAAIQRQAA